MNVLKRLSIASALFVVMLAGCNSTEGNYSKSTSNPQKKTVESQPQQQHNEDDARRITLNEVRAVWEKDNNSVVFIDTRAAAAYEASHIKGAFLLGDFVSRAAEVPKDKLIVAYCT